MNNLSIAWFPDEQEIKLFMKRFEFKPIEEICERIKKTYPIFKKEIEDECAQIEKHNENAGTQKITAENLICDTCGTNLTFWKEDWNEWLGQHKIYRCPMYPKCQGCFKKDTYTIYKKSIRSITNAPLHRFQNRVKQYLECNSLQISTKELSKYLGHLKIKNVYQEMLDKYATGNNDVYAAKKTLENEQKILLVLKKAFEVVHWRKMIFYKMLGDDAVHHAVPDFVIIDKKFCGIIDEKKHRFNINEKQNNVYLLLTNFFWKNNNLYYVLTEDKNEDQFGYKKRVDCISIQELERSLEKIKNRGIYAFV